MKKHVFIRLFAALIVSVMLLSLFACDKSGGEKKQTEGTTTEGESQSQSFDEIYTNPYDVYKTLTQKGYTGTFEEWVALLQGKNGEDGKDGEDGKSAYELAVANGYTGSESEWIASLAGANGANGKSAYELAVDAGYKGSVEEWLVSLAGKNGADGHEQVR